MATEQANGRTSHPYALTKSMVPGSDQSAPDNLDHVEVRHLRMPYRCFFALFLTVVLHLSVNAQGSIGACGTLQASNPEVVRAALALDAARGGDDGPVRTLKVKVIIAAIPTDVGPGPAFQPSEVQAQLDATNAIFANSNTGIQFQLCGPMQVVENYNLWAGNNFGTEALTYYEPGYLNLVFVFELPQGLGGVAFGPMAFVSRFGPRNTLAHEIGHCLGLMHTHDYLIEPELVDGSNCSVGGDMLCDTPADPNLSLPGLMQLPCSYVGTVTDANGDLYQPMLNNVMSYSRCLVDSFTPEQGALMRFHTDSIWTHLRRTTAPITITPFDTRQCDNAAAIPLSATPAPGTFSGPLVTGTTLNNYPNPPGEYSVAYTPINPPEGSTSFVDQFSLPFAWIPSAHNGIATDSVWQSFTPDFDGALQYFDLYTGSTSAQPVRMRLFSGTGPQGAPLADVSSSLAADTAWTRFTLPGNVLLDAGTTYTCLFTAAAPFLAMQPVGTSYSGGVCSLNTADLSFRQWTVSVPECQEATRYYALRQVQQRAVLSLPGAVCHSDERPIRFLVDSLRLENSSTYLDGEPSIGFVPNTLTSGTHTVEHRYTLEGCTDTVTQTFVVEPPPNFTFPNSMPPICTEDEPFVLQGEPSGGYFRINGVRDSLLVPAALGEGTHSIDYIYTAQLDTLLFIDQYCCYTSPPDNVVLEVDQEVWQSFTVGQSGTLEALGIGPDLSFVTRVFEVRLLEGTGTSGTVLWMDTITTAQSYVDLFEGLAQEVTAGSTYTAAIRRLPDTTEGPFPRLLVFNAPGYSGGTVQFPGQPTVADIYFRAQIRQTFPCSDSTSFALVVDVCSGIDDPAFAGVSVGPNPFGEHLVLRTATSALQYRLLSVDGRLLNTGLVGAQRSIPLALPALSAGTYLLQLATTYGNASQVLRVVKE